MLAKFYPFTFLTSPFTGRGEESTVWGHGGQELFDSHSFDKCVLSWTHLSLGVGTWAKQTPPHTSGTSQFGWPTSKWLLPRGDGRVASGGCISSQETGSKWNKPVRIERQSPTSVVEVGMGVPHFAGDRPVHTCYTGTGPVLGLDMRGCERLPFQAWPKRDTSPSSVVPGGNP